MIKLKYYGHSCFMLDFDGYKIVLDPYTGVPGYPKYSIDANEALCSHGHDDHNFVDAVKITKAERPNALTVKEIHGFHDSEGGKLRGDNTLRIFSFNGLKIMHCGDIGVIPTDEQLKEMQGLDAVLIPVGGHFTMEPQECKKFLDLINPRVIIPMHYRKGELGYSVIGELVAFTKYFDNVKVLGSSEFILSGKEDAVTVYELNI